MGKAHFECAFLFGKFLHFHSGFGRVLDRASRMHGRRFEGGDEKSRWRVFFVFAEVRKR